MGSPIYRVPFPKGTEWEDLTSAGHKLSHENFPECRHAKDLGVPLGTVVLASRPGRVAYVKDDSGTAITENPLNWSNRRFMMFVRKYFPDVTIREDEDDISFEYEGDWETPREWVISCFSRFAERYTNCVLIEHGDGTGAEYLHLGKGSAIAEEEGYVKAGEPIGSTGESGLMTAPHLHLNVFNLKDAISLPFELEPWPRFN